MEEQGFDVLGVEEAELVFAVSGPERLEDAGDAGWVVEEDVFDELQLADD